jgi:hypothetical protein
MIQTISRLQCLDRYRQFAHFEENNIMEGDSFFYPKAYSSYTITYKSATFEAHAALLEAEIAFLLQTSGYTSLLFLPNEDTPWLKDPGAAQPATDAVDFLLEHGVIPSFDGCLKVSDISLPVFFRHLINMTHYLDDFPIVHFTDKAQNFMANICSYGNIHIDILNPDLDVIFKDQMEKSKLEIIDGHVCEATSNAFAGLKNKNTVQQLNTTSLPIRP